jgi:hypothetical protein
MSYEIDQRKVIGVLLEANGAISDKGFNHGEVILGLAELIGRTIVEVAETSIQSGELVKVAMAHIELTIRTGAVAQEKRIITAG